MKKVLSLVLAVMMVVGMTTVAFAAPGDMLDSNATVTGVVSATITAGDTKTKTQNVTLATGATKTAGEDIAAPAATVDLLGSNVTPFTDVIDNFVITSTANTKVVTISYELKPGAAAGTYDYKITSTDGSSPDELSLVINNFRVVVKAPSAGQVNTGWKIVGFADPQPAWTPDVSNLHAADMTSKLPLTVEMFKWEDKDGNEVFPAAGAKIRASQLKDIGVRRVYQKGTANTIRDVELRTSDSDVRVRTVKFYPLTKETDVELKLSLTYKGSTKGAPEYEYNFTVENSEEIIEEGQNEASSYGNVFLKADATVRNVEFQGDEDEVVFATKTVVKGQKYYFNVDSELSNADAQIVADNPEVDSIYTVYSTNMANATVQFKNLDREFFVYDAEGKLLGTTKDKKLPLAGKYILTTAKVDFGGADEEPVEEPTVEEPADVDAPPMGGGEVPPSNNYNPNTGL